MNLLDPTDYQLAAIQPLVDSYNKLHPKDEIKIEDYIQQMLTRILNGLADNKVKADLERHDKAIKTALASLTQDQQIALLEAAGITIAKNG